MHVALRSTRPVARISADDRAALAAAIAEEVPVVVARGAAAWPATTTWSAAYLTARVGHVVVDHKLSPSGDHPDFRAPTVAAMFARGRCTIAELLVAITAGPDAERAQRLFTGDERFLLRRRDGVTTLDPELAPLYADVRVPDAVPPDALYTVWAWMSGRGVRTWWHYDNNGCHNLNAQLTGAKTCVLVAPDQLAALAPFPLGGPNPAHNCSQLDIFAADHRIDVDGLVADVLHGDLLFIPAWWSHAFAHRGELNTNVNFWWKPARTRSSVTAMRQALIDAAVAADVARDPGAAALLERLDRAAIAARPPSAAW